MAEIKSALEIALARTEGIEADKEKFALKEIKIKGRKEALAFIENKSTADELAKSLKSYKKAELQAFREGVAEPLMSKLKLPADSSYRDEFSRSAEGLAVLAGNPKDLQQMLSQLEQFFDQYLQNREQMETQMAAQFQPVLKQKEDAIFAQTGSRIKINPLDDPDYQKAYTQNIGKLTQSYQDALDEAREQLKQFIEL